jgi:hypothetical protein
LKKENNFSEPELIESIANNARYPMPKDIPRDCQISVTQSGITYANGIRVTRRQQQHRKKRSKQQLILFRMVDRIASISPARLFFASSFYPPYKLLPEVRRLLPHSTTINLPQA